MTLEGMAQLKTALAKLEEKTEAAMEEAVIAGGLVGERYTKEGAPVDTGKLRRSYATRIEKKTSAEVIARTGTDVDYSVDQEFGTSRFSGTPHLRPGFLNHKPEIVQAATNKLKVI